MHFDLNDTYMFLVKTTTAYIKIYLLLILLNLFFLNAADNTQLDINTSAGIGDSVETENRNFLQTNFNKYINLYQLQIEGIALIQTSYGDVSLRQHYNGNYLNLTDLSSRDDQNWRFTYKKSFYDKLSVLVNQNLILVSDSRNIGINQLSRLNGLVGLEFANNNDYQISAAAGLESNKLLGINSQGHVLSVRARWKDFNLDNITTSGNLSANWLKLNLDRLDRDLIGSLKLFGQFSNEAMLVSSIDYRFLQNNLLSIASNAKFTPIETRQENFINPKILIDYRISEKVALFMDFNLNSNIINREYKNSWKEFDYSYFRRNIDQMDLAISSGLDWQWKFLNHNIILSFWSRSESNTLELADKTYSGDVLKYQNIENQRDYQTSKFNLLNQTLLKFSKNTNLAVNYNVYLLQYDTPSKQNYDDRDEFSSIFRTILNHRFSRFTSIEIVFENIQNHLVYLFSQRSIMNNWNKIYRLSPSVKYENDFLQIHPKFEVLANYTVYDFANKSSINKSISLRNIIYRDSILVSFTKQIENRTQIKYQISDRSLLNWHEFSEFPQIRINEYFIKSLFIRKYRNGEIGIGCNYFDYKQSKIQENLLDYDVMSISPEVLIVYRWRDWQIKFTGWYEFQYQNKNKINEVANMNMSINMFFD